MKQERRKNQRKTGDVAPLRGRGLKLVETVTAGSLLDVAPLRGRGLKLITPPAL